MDARDPRQQKTGDWPQDCLFEGTASELLEIIALGTPDDLPADSARMSKEISDIEPRLNVLGIAVDRFKKGDQRVIRIDVSQRPVGKARTPDPLLAKPDFT